MIQEGRRDWLSARVLLPLYGAIRHKGIRDLLRRLALRREGGALYTLTVREMLRRHHGVEVGLYTIGPCEAGPEGLDPGTVIGRYGSIYYTVRTLCEDDLGAASDPKQLYFPACLGKRTVSASDATPVKLRIGHDVFIGHNAVILASVGEIGHGAFIGAGAVVQKAVPPYAVVMGNPARVVRYRFAEETIRQQLASEWWLKSPKELKGEWESFQGPLEQISAVLDRNECQPNVVTMLAEKL